MSQVKPLVDSSEQLGQCTLQTVKFEFGCMTTRCVLQLIHNDIEHLHHVAQQIYANSQRLEATYNFFAKSSWLTQALNQRTRSKVSLDDEAWEIFTQVRKLSEATQGVFDITVGSLRLPPALLSPDPISFNEDKRISHLQALYQQGLSREQIAEQWQHDSANPVMGLKAWSLDALQHCLYCHHELTRFDLGGVVKEFAVDAAMSIAQQAGCQGLISFGGDLRALGYKTNNQTYQVGIKNPFNPSQTCLSVPLIDQALTTSGRYERCDQVGDQQLSHLVTSQPSSAALTALPASLPASVTVISPSTLVSGVYSTSLMLNPDLPLPAFEAFGEIKVILIDQAAKLHAMTNTNNQNNK